MSILLRFAQVTSSEKRMSRRILGVPDYVKSKLKSEINNRRVSEVGTKPLDLEQTGSCRVVVVDKFGCQT